MRAPLHFSRIACALIFTLGMLSVGPHALADEPLAKVEGEMSDDLRELIYDVMGEAEDPATSVAQARRRLKAAGKAADSVMRSQGYYSAIIDRKVIEAAADEPGDTAAAPQAVLIIKTGKQFKYGTIGLELSDRLTDLERESLTERSLKTGDPALAAKVVAAELRITNYLNNNGYPDAKALEREVIVDHDLSAMNVTFKISTGQKTRFGQIEQTGTAYLAKSWPQMVAPFKSEDVFDSRDLNKLNARIIGTGVFDGSTAVLSNEKTDNPDGTVTRNVLLNVEQGAINTVSSELGFSTTDGSGATLTYERRNFIGYAQTLTIDAVAKTNQIGVGANYNIPFAWRVDREIDLGAEVAREETEAFTGERANANAFITQKFSNKFKIGLGFGVEASRFEENGEDITSYVVDGLGRATFDNRNNIFDPEKGFFLEASLTPSYNLGEEDGFFTTAVLSGSTYKRVSDKIILAGRAQVGSIVTTDFSAIPRNRRFYAGGGGSVRGFGFQSISPENADGDLTGGRSITELSGEVRYRGESAFGFAAFVDAGSASRAEYPTFDDVRVGAGLGVRYYTSFAPLRADIAIPLNKRDGDNPVQVYISIGQSF